jgi:hypothetical protein
MSTDPVVAYSQAQTMASSHIVPTLQSLGFAAGSAVYFDIESFNTSNSTCTNAVTNFLLGFAYELYNFGYEAGVYGSSCGSNLSAVAGAGGVNQVDYAHWNSVANVWNAPCLSNSQWVYDARTHQYRGTHTDSYGGVSLSIDSDCGLSKMNASLLLPSETEPQGSSESQGPTEDPACNT